MANLIFLILWIIAYVKWFFSKLLAICYIFTQLFLWKHVVFIQFLFHLKKAWNTYLLTTTIKSENPLKSIEDSEYTLNSAIILSLSLLLFCNFQRLTQSFAYVNMFWSSGNTLSHLIKWCQESSTFQEKKCYIMTNLQILNGFFLFFFWLQMTSSILKIVFIITKKVFFHILLWKWKNSRTFLILLIEHSMRDVQNIILAYTNVKQSQ